MADLIGTLNSIIWGLPMLVILTGTHLVMTVKTGLIQRHLPLAIKFSVTKEKGSEGDVSPFQALTTALASTIGTGNIIGLGTAVALGGAGAVFWCWFTGILGIATKYAESLIAVKFRVKTDDGRILGGAMYVLENQLHKKGLANFFAVCTVLSAFGVGCGVQINSISEIVTNTVKNGRSLNFSLFSFTLPTVPVLVGTICAFAVCLVIFGGVKSISSVCEKLVPLMAGLYVIGCIIILVLNHDVLSDTVLLIVKSAFTPTAAAGGLVGYTVSSAIRFGISRGLFSNESGMGSAPIVAAAAQTKSPVRQALVSSTGTFWDTVVLCLISGLVIVSSIVKYDCIDVNNLSGGELTAAAFAQIPCIGTPILVFGMITFAFSTILGWSYYGESCAEYLFGKNFIQLFRVVYVLVLVIAPLITADVMWELADILNALMALPNLTALWLMRNTVAEETRLFFSKKE